MILPDVNLLVYAHDEAAPFHARAVAWWDGLVNRQEPVGLPWAVVFGFVRLVSNPSVMKRPLAPAAALDRVDRWLERDHIAPLDPGPRHLRIARTLFEATGVGANLTTDTHLAALAIEHQCELQSNDADFDRFPGLRWRNPLEP